MNTCRAVLFDAADTLFYNRELADRMRAFAGSGDPRLGCESMSRSVAAVGGRGLWPQDSATATERLARWTKFYTLVMLEAGLAGLEAARLGTHLAKAVADPASYAAFPDVEPALAELAAAGLLTGIVSNFDPLLAAILDHLDLGHRFPVMVTSYEVGCYKPDPRIFRVALLRLGLPAEAVVFVGDSVYSDIHGARSAGITPVLIDRASVHAPGDYTRITGLHKLAGVLP